MRNLSAAALASTNASSTGEVWLVCLTIRHASITPGGKLNLVNNVEDITRVIASVSTVFTAYPFQITLPGQDGDQQVTAGLRLDNVDRQIVQAIRGLTSRPQCDLEVVLASSPSTVEIGYYDMTLRAATYDSLYVESELSIEQIFVEPVSLDMTPQRFPGMF